jgi:hypothetical protein
MRCAVTSLAPLLPFCVLSCTGTISGEPGGDLPAASGDSPRGTPTDRQAEPTMGSPAAGPSGAAPFACTDPTARQPTLSYTLTKAQYRNVVADLFGAKVVNAIQDQLSALPADVFDKVTNSRLTGISAAKVEAYLGLAKGISAAVIGSSANVTSVFGACAAAASPAPSCIDSYVNDFGQRLFRRPLAPDEVGYARQMASAPGSYLTNMGILLTVQLMSPAFLWRLEVNGTAVPGTPTTKLTSHEVASRISFLTTDSTPDPMLMAAAAAGQLATKEQVQGQVRRLLQTTAGRAKVRNSILRWSLQDRVADAGVDRLPAPLTQGVQLNGLTQAMLDEAGAYVDYEVYGKASSFRTLLTSKESFASHPGLAAIYGHPPTSPTTAATVAGRRQGLLMRASFLASSQTRTPIIQRGADFARLILCSSIPDPDPETIVSVRDKPVFTPAEMLLHSNRDVITRQTEPAMCQGCHRIINSPGFAFEGFDSAGRIRAKEAIFSQDGKVVNDVPVDTSSWVTRPDGSQQPVQDAYDLVSHVASSPEGSACLTRNVHRFVHERIETDKDACSLAAVHRILNDPNRPVLEAMTELIANDQILYKQN